MEFEGNEDKKEEEIRSNRPKLKDFIPIFTPAVETPRERTLLDRFSFLRQTVNWPCVVGYCKNWIKHPMNMALLVWLFFVAVGLVVLFLLMTGALNDAIPNSSERSRWTEITNQILNALFTVACLYQYPRLVQQLVILCRWRPSDAAELRQAYCKSTASSPHERAHVAVVVSLLHITCWSQFALCGLYWGWSSDGRPGWAADVCIALGTGAPIVAGLYTVYSPLGKKKNEDEADTDEAVKTQQSDTQWAGGVFDCWDDATVSCLSFFCTCCVFGRNAERLGFGNMYVHAVTFALLCVGPLLVFNVAALNIADDALRIAMRVAGVVLCFLGLFYGGFWRTQMRRKFKLAGNPFCCGSQSVTDWMLWLFCGPCSLAQEVRTGNLYVIERRERSDIDESSSSSMSFDEEMPRDEKNQKMSPPLPQLVHMDGKTSLKN